ncbi:PAS domain-containing protein [Tamlana fucoidanivorans]|nr:LuxR C-terminal-related transcriptional regulator [Tamlana fucoidanivorans]
MQEENINKLMAVWKEKNTILKPSIRKDITDLVNQMASIFAAGNFYYLIMNFEISELECVSEGTKAVLGIEPNALSLKTFLDLVHPEDLNKMREKELASLNFKLNEIAKKEITKYKTVYLLRIKCKNGGYKTVLHQSKALSVSEDGKVFQTICVHTDITHLNPTIDHKISFISQECPSYYSLDTGSKFKLVKNSFQNLFSPREKEVIKLIAKGKTTPEIALILFISEQTIQKHKKNILQKSHCRNAAELITTSIREGII